MRWAPISAATRRSGESAHAEGLSAYSSLRLAIRWCRAIAMISKTRSAMPRPPCRW